MDRRCFISLLVGSTGSLFFNKEEKKPQILQHGWTVYEQVAAPYYGPICKIGNEQKPPTEEEIKAFKELLNTSMSATKSFAAFSFGKIA